MYFQNTFLFIFILDCLKFNSEDLTSRNHLIKIYKKSHLHLFYLVWFFIYNKWKLSCLFCGNAAHCSIKNV